jgi:hypothetical protein
VYGLGGDAEGIRDRLPAPPVASGFSYQFGNLVFQGLAQLSDRVQRV